MKQTQCKKAYIYRVYRIFCYLNLTEIMIFLKFELLIWFLCYFPQNCEKFTKYFAIDFFLTLFFKFLRKNWIEMSHLFFCLFFPPENYNFIFHIFKFISFLISNSDFFLQFYISSVSFFSELQDKLLALFLERKSDFRVCIIAFPHNFPLNF